MPPTPRPLAGTAACSLMTIVFFAGQAADVSSGQPIAVPRNTRPPDEAKPAPSTAGEPRLPGTVAAAELSKEQLRIDTVGLSMSVPEGCVIVQASTADGTSGFNVVPQTSDWAMTVSPRRTRTDQTSVQQTADAITQQTQALAAGIDTRTGEMTHSRVITLHRDMDFRINGCESPGARLYFAIPNEKGPRTIKGFTIFKPLPGQFVIFEFSTLESGLDKARAAYELSVATAVFKDPTATLKARSDALSAGLAFASQLNESSLLAAMPQGQLGFRLYQPGPTPQTDAEKGYRVVSYERGKRSDVGRDISATVSRDDPEGIVLTVRARILAPRGGIIDTETVAFLSFDRNSEAWVTRTSVREGESSRKPAQVFSESGVRQGKSLSVLVRQPGKPDRATQHELQGNEYLSQIEVQLLPTLLDKNSAAGELGFYSYRADSGTISLRRDRVEPQKDGCKITTTLREGDETLTTLVRDSSRYIRTELADGSIWEPIDPEALLRLWRSKNLPTGK